MKKLFFLLVLAFTMCTGLRANNIEVKNIAITGQNVAQQYSFIKFDLSWENSWRLGVGPSNWDAAWVFVKYRVNGGNWNHAQLNYINGTADGHTVPAGVSIKTVNDGLAYGLGSFIYRSADGSGDVNYQNVQLRWNYGANGVGNNDLVDVQVFAVEMVYVPQGGYNLGGGTGSELAKFYKAPTTTQSYDISSEAAITVGAASGNLNYTASTNTGDGLGPIPTAYPKGFNSYYCMKYEISQDQWVSFFNTLTDAQKLNRDITDVGHKNTDAIVNRNAVSWTGSGDATTSLPNVACNFTTGADGLAYLDWAALRPMSEMEFEKSCRGPLPAVAGEFAWGNANLNNTQYTLSNAGTPSEGIANPGNTGNAATGITANANITGPVRCGIFAASAINKNREETGGSYYGIMELSGNVDERTITAGSPAGRAFTGLHGNGIIAANGNSDVLNWTNNGGARGGAWGVSFFEMRTSDRSYVTQAGDPVSAVIGPHRGVRTAN